MENRALETALQSISGQRIERLYVYTANPDVHAADFLELWRALIFKYGEQNVKAKITTLSRLILMKGEVYGS